MDMNMNMTDSMSLTSDDYCYLGDHNGTWPNGTVVAGATWMFGHYMPTSAIRSACQLTNDPWAASIKYGFWTTYVLLAFFFVCAALNSVERYQSLTRAFGLPSLTLVPHRVQAFVRAVDTPRLHRSIPPLGSVITGLGLLLFGLALSFALRPYYRPPNFGSSALGLRAEWLATAPIPFVIATATKRNPLGWLTGMSFSRLMDMHKILGWFIFFFAIVHTVAMMVRALRQAPWSYTLHTSPLSYGWAAWGSTITLGWLCVMSLGPVRRLSHETFYVLHMVNVLLFMVFMYYHCIMELNSWSYLHAAAALLALAIVHRFGVVVYHTRAFTRVWRARVDSIENGALSITIPARGFTWTAGDYVFVRFLTVQPWATHPFTIVSIPSLTSPEDSEIKIILRPRTGLTAKLARQAVLRPLMSFPVHIDGPYAATGGALTTLAGSDSILLLAGGTGMSYVLPLLTALVQGGVSTRQQKVKLVWAVPRRECVQWYRAEIDNILKDFGAGTHSVAQLELEVHVSGEEDGESLNGSSESGEVKGEAEKSGAQAPALCFVGGRPDVARIVRDATQRATGTQVVVGCGPDGLLQAARNEVASAQLDIARGNLDKLDQIIFIEELFD